MELPDSSNIACSDLPMKLKSLFPLKTIGGACASSGGAAKKMAPLVEVDMHPILTVLNPLLFFFFFVKEPRQFMFCDLARYK